MRYPHLFSPFMLGGVEVRNRVVVLPMGTRFADAGRPSDRDVAFYAARARGGVGLIITGGTVVHENSAPRERDLHEAFRPEYRPDYARLADAVHRHGTKLFAQLMHRGREANPANVGASLLAASALPSATTPVTPRAMSTAEIADVVEGYAASARNLVDAGFDGLEIHAAHGYLLGGFLSPATNHRDDAYGGSSEARARFVVEVATALRAELPDGAALGVRISGDEEIEGGIDPAEAGRLARLFEATGLIDYVSVAIGIRGAYLKDMSHPTGIAVPLARAVRDATTLPVIASQRITHPALAEEILADGDADLIGLARAHVADPAWTAKAAAGTPERILPCVGCLQECRSRHVGVGCVHNPTSGHEAELGAHTTATTPRRVVVVGAGPAGLEAARIAAERGHEVLVLERAREPGGQVRLAATAPHRAELDGVVSFRTAELQRLGVELRLGVDADAATVLAQRPDAVVVATGAGPLAPRFEVADDARVLDPWALFEPRGRSGRLSGTHRAVVIDDGTGFWEGVSAAELLAADGVAVTLVTPARQVGGAIPVESVGPTMRRLRARNVTLRPMTAVAAVEADRVSVYDPFRLAAVHTLEEEHLPADLVVLAGPKLGVGHLRDELTAEGLEVHAAGDCLSPRQIRDAIVEGHLVGRAL